MCWSDRHLKQRITVPSGYVGFLGLLAAALDFLPRDAGDCDRAAGDCDRDVEGFDRMVDHQVEDAIPSV